MDKVTPMEATATAMSVKGTRAEVTEARARVALETLEALAEAQAARMEALEIQVDRVSQVVRDDLEALEAQDALEAQAWREAQE